MLARGIDGLCAHNSIPRDRRQDAADWEKPHHTARLALGGCGRCYVAGWLAAQPFVRNLQALANRIYDRRLPAERTRRQAVAVAIIAGLVSALILVSESLVRTVSEFLCRNLAWRGNMAKIIGRYFHKLR